MSKKRNKRQRPERVPPKQSSSSDPGQGQIPPKPPGATSGEHPGGELVYHPIVPGDLCILISASQKVIITVVTETTNEGIYISSTLTLNPQYPKGNGFIGKSAISNGNHVRFVFQSELIAGFNVLVGKEFSSYEDFSFQILLFSKGDPLDINSTTNN